jgi:hypothetical protein
MVVSSGDAPAFGGGGGVPALIATIAPTLIKQRTASHTVLITSSSRMVRVCEFIVSVGLNRALRRRPGPEAHNMMEEFNAKVNEGMTDYALKCRSSSAGPSMFHHACPRTAATRAQRTFAKTSRPACVDSGSGGVLLAG